MVVIDLGLRLWDNIAMAWCGPASGELHEPEGDGCPYCDAHEFEALECSNCGGAVLPLVLFLPGHGRRFLVVCHYCQTFHAYGMEV